MFDVSNDRQLAYGLFRATLGVNIMVHGVVRLPNLGKFADAIVERLAAAPLPDGLVHYSALVLPFAELGIGALLLIGLFTRRVLVAGMLVMLVLSLGTALAQDWPVLGVQLVYEIAYFLLLFFHSENRLSVDGWRALR